MLTISRVWLQLLNASLHLSNGDVIQQENRKENRSGSDTAIFNGSDQAFGEQQRARNAKIFDQLSSCIRQNSASKSKRNFFISELSTLQSHITC